MPPFQCSEVRLHSISIVVAGIAALCSEELSKIKEYAHSFIMLMFPDLISKSVYLIKDKGEDDETRFESDAQGASTTGPQAERGPWIRETCLFSGKEFNSKSDSAVIPTNFLDEPEPKSIIVQKHRDFMHIYTYLYYMFVSLLASLWFVVITLENAIYRESGTCNDTNVRNSSFTCFEPYSSEAVNCTGDTSYLYDLNLEALGIGFSTFNMIIFVVTVYSKIAI